jgi:hypothetical protein
MTKACSIFSGKTHRGVSCPKARNSRGNILIIVIVIGILLIVVCGGLYVNVARLLVVRNDEQTAIEAACLAAVGDISKIVINDEHFGYVSLSDYPPFGQSTRAPDGEPVCVLGINTILGTCRLETILANQLDEPDLQEMAEADRLAALKAARTLTDAIKSSLDPDRESQARDLDGNIVKPYEHARDLYYSHLRRCQLMNSRLTPDEFHLSLGWLKGGGSTVTCIPQPEQLSDVPPGGNLNGNYRAFVDAPVDGVSFYFTGVAAQPALADLKQFMPPDAKRICSVVKAEADIYLATSGQSASPAPLHVAACAQPWSNPDLNPPSLLQIKFPNGPVPGIKCMRDILSNRQLRTTKVPLYTARAGDYPLDPASSLSQCATKTVSQVFARGFYDWIRSAHCKPRLDSVISIMDTPFFDPSTSGSATPACFVYECDRQGNVTVTRQDNTPFLSEEIFENQLYTVDFQALITGNRVWTMSFRDQVDKLGTTSGGKHAGQPLAGDPVNWCELKEFNGSVESAFAKTKGGKALGLSISGEPAPGTNGGITLASASFQHTWGDALANQPRKSYYSGGLGVEFVLSSPRMANGPKDPTM